MKRLLVMTCTISLILVSRAIAQHFWHGDIMPAERVEKTWGLVKFDKAKFKEGDLAARASMAADLVKGKSYRGKSRLDVVRDLGPGDGYYFSGMIPAYIINDPAKKGDDVWQIAFLIDKKGLVTDVVVHKNCCDK